jgi:L-fuculose-phosphate aldolase
MVNHGAGSGSRRFAVVDAAVKLAQQGLNRGTSGNVSMRWDEGFLITPSGMPPHKLVPDDVVYIDLDGNCRGRRRPSSEWRMHRDIYAAKPEVEGVVHGHPPFSVALAALQMPIPPYHYMVAKAGGRDIPCAPYATYGTQQLSDHALAALQARKACLLANHGMIAVGASLDSAMALAVEVEELAEGYWRALQVGQPVLLDDDEIARVLEKFSTYGEHAQTALVSDHGKS